MDSAPSTPSAAEVAPLSGRSPRGRRAVALALLAGLLLLRFAVLAGLGTLVRVTGTGLSEDVLLGGYEIGTYLLTACLIWWERERLVEFHVDTLAVAMLVLSKPVEALIGTAPAALSFPRPLSFTYFVIALGLLAALRRSRTAMPPVRAANVRWLAVALLAGVVTAAVCTVVAEFPAVVDGLSWRGAAGPGYIVRRLVQQTGFAAAVEEPLFRGFLWGYLRGAGWRNGWILLFQAALFVLAHAYYLPTRPVLGVTVFLGAVVLGLLAWRSRSIATSMVGHTTVNTFGDVFMHTIAR